MNQEQGCVPTQIVAVITAAISAMIDRSVGSFIITGIQPVAGSQLPGTSAWAKAGVIESHLARTAFGARTR